MTLVELQLYVEGMEAESLEWAVVPMPVIVRQLFDACQRAGKDPSELEGYIDDLQSRVKALEEQCDTLFAEAMGGRAKPPVDLKYFRAYSDEAVKETLDAKALEGVSRDQLFAVLAGVISAGVMALGPDRRGYETPPMAIRRLVADLAEERKEHAAAEREAAAATELKAMAERTRDNLRAENKAMQAELQRLQSELAGLRAGGVH